MTCVVGIENNGSVFFGADSATVNQHMLTIAPSAHPKVFESGPFIFGYAGSWRVGQLLHHKLVAPQVPEPGDDPTELDVYMVGDFMDAVRATLAAGGALQNKNDREKMPGTEFIVGVHGRIYTVHNDLQAMRLHRPYAAIGCGDEYALGALHVLSKQLAPKERVKRALEAAAEHSAGVIPPFVFISG